MFRRLLVSTLVFLGACKDEAAPQAAPSASATPSADDAQAEPVEGEAAPGEAKEGPGLSGVVKATLGEFKASESTLLIPEGATVLVGLDIRPFVRSPLFEPLKAQLGRRQREQLEAATRCGVGPEKWRSFVIGVDPATRDMAMVTEAVGVGTPATLRCLVAEIGTFTLSEDGKRMSDHTGGGIVLHDDAIAFATPAWMGPLEERIAGKGTAAAKGSLASVLARTDSTKPLWFAGVIPAREQGMAQGMLGSEPTDVAGIVDVKDGVELRVTVAVPDPAVAKQKLQLQWNMVRGMVINQGMPQAVADSVTIDQADGTLSLGLDASAGDVERMLTKVLPR